MANPNWKLVIDKRKPPFAEHKPKRKVSDDDKKKGKARRELEHRLALKKINRDHDVDYLLEGE